MTGTVTPRWRAIGDDWSFPLQFVEVDGLTPFNLTGKTVTADFYVAGRTTALSSLSIGPGPSMPDPLVGAVALTIPSVSTALATPQDPGAPSNPFFAPVYPTRIALGLTDQGTALHKTVGLILLAPYAAGQVLELPFDDESPVVIPVAAFPSVPAVDGFDLSVPGDFFLF